MERFDEFDHCVIAVNDLELTEHFYGAILGEILGGCAIGEKTMMTTDEIIQSKQQASRRARLEGHEASVSASHGSVKFGEALIPIFLNQEMVQEPPPEQLRGTPRLGLPITPEQMERAVEVLRRHRIPFEGPIELAAPCPAERSIFLKDPSSNFLELSVPRDIGGPKVAPSPYSSYADGREGVQGQRLTE